MRNEEQLRSFILKKRVKLELVSEVVFDLDKSHSLFTSQYKPEELLAQIVAELPNKFFKGGVSIKTSAEAIRKFNIKAFILECLVD